MRVDRPGNRSMAVGDRLRAAGAQRTDGLRERDLAFSIGFAGLTGVRGSQALSTGDAPLSAVNESGHAIKAASENLPTAPSLRDEPPRSGGHRDQRKCAWGSPSQRPPPYAQVIHEVGIGLPSATGRIRSSSHASQRCPCGPRGASRKSSWSKLRRSSSAEAGTAKAIAGRKG